MILYEIINDILRGKDERTTKNTLCTSFQILHHVGCYGAVREHGYFDWWCCKEALV